MIKFLVPGALALALSAAPAMANEARLEARGGVIWDQDESEAIAGVAAGYDWDLGSHAFAGLEVSGDKILTDDTRISFGFGGRVGAKLGDAGKLYVVSTYETKPCHYCADSVAVGAGYQHSFGEKFYGKVEYRHFFAGDNVSDPDAVTAGLGVKF